MSATRSTPSTGTASWRSPPPNTTSTAAKGSTTWALVTMWPPSRRMPLPEPSAVSMKATDGATHSSTVRAATGPPYRPHPSPSWPVRSRATVAVPPVRTRPAARPSASTDRFMPGVLGTAASELSRPLRWCTRPHWHDGAVGALESLVELLDLEPIELNLFRGPATRAEGEGRHRRVFGGQVAAQALVAAGRTVPDDRPVHSLHAYFLRPGDPTRPILYQVDRIRDGRSFTTRRVVAVQGGQAIFNLAASFHVAEDGYDHQRPAPAAPRPEDLPTFGERMAPWADQLGPWYSEPRPLDLRYVDDPHLARGRGPRPPCEQVWVRADGRLPDEPLLHACVVTYASDITLLDSVLLAHDATWADPGLFGASLDHAMWFHRPFRADEWLLYDQESASAAGARGLGQGRIFTVDGVHVVSVVQEGLLRRRPRDEAPR